MNFPQDFEKVFYFEQFTPALDNKEFLLKKLQEEDEELNFDRGLIMILRKCNFGLFSYIILNGFDKKTREFNFLFEDVRYDGRKGYQEGFRKLEETYNNFNIGPNGGKIPINSKKQRKSYLVTDIERFKSLSLK